jgi:enoyl-CoA hydratase/carnithine racemase
MNVRSEYDFQFDEEFKKKMLENAQIAPQVLITKSGYITTLTLNRAAQFNPLSFAMLKAMQAALDEVAKSDARVVVIAAEGKAFCAGHDLKEMRANPSQSWQESLFSLCSEVMMSLTKLPQPTIARVQGIATAAGCQLVSMCDLAVASEEARFATSGVNLGLFCSTPAVGVSRNLSRKRAMEILLTGDFLSAAQALEFGLVNRVVPAAKIDAEINEIAQKIANKSPTAIRMGKTLFYKQIEATLPEAYALAAETMVCNMQAEDAKAGVDAFIGKRPMPKWQGS